MQQLVRAPRFIAQHIRRPNNPRSHLVLGLADHGFPTEERGSGGSQILKSPHWQLCHQEGRRFCTGQDDRVEQDILHRLHLDICQILLCLNKFCHRGLLASVCLGNSIGGHTGLERFTKYSRKLMMDPYPENFIRVISLSKDRIPTGPCGG